ncbi:MAG: spondin domain-containing protein [Aureliella sp.]
MRIRGLVVCLATLLCVGNASGAIVDVTVTFQNLAPTNSISYAPIHVGFGNGTFDAFTVGNPATGGIVPLAETGSGAQWMADFTAAEANAVTGSLGAPPILPGASVSNTFRIDTDVNQFFTFAGMVLPSNDLFIGNDNPQAFQLLDGAGNLLVNQINQSAAQIWDANSEQAIPANAAFIVGSNAGDRVPEGGNVAFDFSELQAYDGLNTPAYEFDADLITATTAIGRFSFSATAVPEPGSLSLLGLVGLGIMVRRRRES